MATPDTVTGPVNLGNPVEITVADLAKHIIDLIGSRSSVEYRPLPADDPTQRCPDITLARETLGWEPRVALDTGLKRTIAYFEQLISKGDERASMMTRRQA